MIEIGQLLRQTRESKNLTLADVEAETRIRQRYLNALESGDWDDLPNPVAARGFLRRYATFLGLDPDELTTQFDEIQAAEQAANPAQVTTPSPSDYRPIDLDLYDVGSRRSRTFRRILTWILVLIPAIILIYLLFAYGLPYLQNQSTPETGLTPTQELPPEGQAPAAPVIRASPTTTPLMTPQQEAPQATTIPPTFTPTPGPTDTPTITASPTLTPTPAEAIRLRVVVTNTAWIRVVTDGQVQIESLVDPGFDQEFIAYQQLEFLTGNAGGVQLTLDGEPLPPLGDIGQVMLFIWTIQDGQVVEITPTPSPTPAESATPPPAEPPNPEETPTPPAQPTPGG